MPHARVAWFVAHADFLPSLPLIVSRLLELMADDSVRLNRVAQLVEADPALVARVLAMANAGVHGSRRVGTVAQAVTFLGANRVRDVAINNAMLEVFAFDVPPSLRSLWLESLAVAVCAEEIAACAGANCAMAYMAGLLHDIGKLLLYAVLRDEYLQVLDLWRAGDRPLSDVERSTLGVDHAMVGSALARAWGLPDLIVDAIRGHSSPVDGKADLDRTEMAAIVHQGVVLAHALDLAQVPGNRVPAMSEHAFALLDIRWQQYTTLFPRIEGRFLHIRHLLGCKLPDLGGSFCEPFGLDHGSTVIQGAFHD